MVSTGLAVAASAPVALHAERLPIKAYTTADGLGHNVVNKIVRDSRGFLWFATNDGLSRFDGYGFTNYSVEQGLPHRRVTDLLETAAGELWVATYAGLVRFHPAGAATSRIVPANGAPTPLPMFTVIVPDASDPDARIVTALTEGRDGTLWCGTRRGLFRLERTDARWHLLAVDLGMPTDSGLSAEVTDLLEDRSGTLWVAGVTGLYRRFPDGRVARFYPKLGPFDTHFQHLRADRQDRLWASTRYTGLLLLDISRGDDPPAILEQYSVADGLPTPWVYEIRETSDGRFWLATNYGLVELLRDPASGAVRFRTYSRRHGLTHHAPNTLAEDAAGNLWMGTEAAGAMRMTRNGFTTWSLEDGIVFGVDFVEDAEGQLYMTAAMRGDLIRPRGLGKNINFPAEDPLLSLVRVGHQGFEVFQPPPPFSFGWSVPMLRTRRNEWWIAGDSVAYRFAPLPRLLDIRTAKPAKIFTMRDGPAYSQVMHFFEDSRGGVWISTLAPTWGLLRWDPPADRLRDMKATPGLPAARGEFARAFAQDAEGHVWIGFNTGVARYGQDRFDFYASGDVLPPGRILAIRAGPDGCLWLASSEGGLVRVDDAASAHPRFRAYTMADGLSSNVIEAITLDLAGRVYAATSHGIDQVDPTTGRVRQLSIEHDFAPGTVNGAFMDRTGALWFATIAGIARFTPERDAPSSSPDVFVTGLRIAGEPHQISAVGGTATELSDLAPGASQLEIHFVAIGSGPSRSLRYQYRLDGADREWGPLTTQRSVNYARLAPGRYQFLVRAVTADGAASATPATVSFVVLPPFWRTWWFLSGLAIAAAAAAYVFHRYRVARIVELERVRTRIATDLHDDVGANLTRIAILSEVAKRGAAGKDPEGEGKLSAIASIARESVSSMGDIVWAISPDRDALQEVVRKMRHCAEEAFDGREVVVTFDAPDPSQTMSLGIDIRRDVYLIFKEAVNNAARHARCTKVTIVFRVSAQQLLLEIADDGIGLDVTAPGDGTGLASMRRRAARLGATLDIASNPDRGTRVTLTMLAPPARATDGTASRGR